MWLHHKAHDVRKTAVPPAPAAIAVTTAIRAGKAQRRKAAKSLHTTTTAPNGSSALLEQQPVPIIPAYFPAPLPAPSSAAQRPTTGTARTAAAAPATKRPSRPLDPSLPSSGSSHSSLRIAPVPHLPSWPLSPLSNAAASSAEFFHLTPALWTYVLSFLVPVPLVANTGLALTCRSFHALLLTIASSPAVLSSAAYKLPRSSTLPVNGRSVNAHSPAAAQALYSSPFRTPPRRPERHVKPLSLSPSSSSSASFSSSSGSSSHSLPSKYKLQKSLILQAAAQGIDVSDVISAPWWELDQAAVDVMRQSLIHLLTPPRSPSSSLTLSPAQAQSFFSAPPSSLPLSPREVAKWHQHMQTVDSGYVKQLRRRRLRAKQQAGVKGEELDTTRQRRERNEGAATDLSINASMHSLSASFTSSPRSPALPEHCYVPPPLPPFLSASSASSVSFWQEQVLPRWAEMSSHPLTLRLWSKEGVPAACRRQVWLTRIGNECNVTDETFRQYWRGDAAEASDAADDENKSLYSNGQPPRPAAGQPLPTSPFERTGSVSSLSSPSSASVATPITPPSPSTPLPDVIHAFSLPAVAMMAAEASLSNQLDAVPTPAHTRRASIHNDLLRMFDAAHLRDVAALDALRAPAGLPPLFSALHGLLATFTVYAPETSYVQGMSYMVVLLLLWLPVSEAFTCLCSLLRHDWYAAYMHMNVSAMQRRCSVFAQLLRHNAPRLHAHLASLPPDTYFVEWMLTFYVPLLSFGFTSALLDRYLLQGEEAIYRAAIALMWLGEPQLLHMGVMEASQWLRGGLKDGGGVDEDELWHLMPNVDFPPSAKAFFARRSHHRAKTPR